MRRKGILKNRKKEWINHISRNMSLTAVYYPFYVQAKKDVFDFKSKNLYFSEEGFVKGYKSPTDEENTIKQIRKHVEEGELKEILEKFKKIIKKRIRLSNKFVSTDLEGEGLNWVIKEFENFHEFYLEYWSYHIFAFNLKNAVENTKYESLLEEHKELIKRVRGFHPFFFFDEEYLPHFFKYLEKKYKIPQEKFYNLSPIEIIRILKRGEEINLEEIKRREKYYLLKWDRNKEKLLSGKRALREYQQVVKPRKDGDLVEVDANKGIVKIIKRHKN